MPLKRVTYSYKITIYYLFLETTITLTVFPRESHAY